MHIYETTHGTQWTDRSNWGTGDPCTDRWYGISCCHESTPYYRQYIRSGELHSDWTRNECIDDWENPTQIRRPFRWNDLTQPQNETTPLGCFSGSITGTTADTSSCVVVAIELERNQLSGTINISFADLRYMQELALLDNNIVGPLPEQCACSSVLHPCPPAPPGRRSVNSPRCAHSIDLP